MAEYSSMFIVSALASILFFGGPHGPIPVTEILGFAGDSLGNPGMEAFSEETAKNDGFFAATQFGLILSRIIGVVNLLIKGCIGVTVMMWVRWSFPRLRIDQVMTMCLKYCVPLAAIGFLGATTWQALDLPTGTTLTGSHRYEYHELWTAGLKDKVLLDQDETADSSEAPIPHENDTQTEVNKVPLKTVPVSVLKGGER